MTDELCFRAMGSEAHVIVVGGRPGLAAEARHRIDDLEARWSRFRPESEVSALTRHAGRWVAVSPETAELVTKSLAAWRRTDGRYDPTVLGAVIRAGYDRSFDLLGPGVRAGHSGLAAGCAGIEVGSRAVRLPTGTGFDPGGIGKGLAADLVSGELIAAGAVGACVNLGGDLRVRGDGPDGDAWTVAVEHPWSRDPIARLGLRDGAVATSTTLRRRWTVDGQAGDPVTAHHLIDPATGAPSQSELNTATVVDRDAWSAEALATAVLLAGREHSLEVLDHTGAALVAVDDRGAITASPGLEAFLGDTALSALVAAPHQEAA